MTRKTRETAIQKDIPPAKTAKKNQSSRKAPFSRGQDALFDIASFLYSGLNMERRQAQLDMIARLCETCEQAERKIHSLEGSRILENTGHIPVEVRFGQIPTGTGKSMAVILTALAAWLKWGLNSVVATHTHVLQDQLIGKDFPFIKKRLLSLLGEETLEKWRSVLVKGIENYPCMLKMEHLYGSAMSTPGKTILVHGRNSGDVTVVMAGKIAEMKDAIKRKTFEISEDDPLFHLVKSDRESCMGEECPHIRTCPYINLMRIKSPFIVTNHAYLLSSVRSISQRGDQEPCQDETVPGGIPGDTDDENGEKKKEKVLSPFRSADLYFFDEAHHLMGYRALGKTLHSVSLRGMENLLSFAVPGNRLDIFRTEKEFRLRFLALARKILLSESTAYPEDEMSSLLSEWTGSTGSFDGVFGNSIRNAQSFARVRAGEVRGFKEAERELVSGAQTGSKDPDRRIRKLSDDDSVRLVLEGEANLLEDMKGALPLVRSVFCFSGTLFTSTGEDGKEGEAFEAETGLVPTMPSFSSPSPFAFDAVRVWVPENAPLGAQPKTSSGGPEEPDLFASPFSGTERGVRNTARTRKERESEHDEFVERFCKTYIPPYLKEDLGGILVLCSSKARMERIASAVAAEVESRGMPRWIVMKQGERAKKNLAKSFVKASQSAVLFGSSSFREGFDVRGRQLTWVIIDRLPFPVPGSEETRKIKELKKWGYIRNEFLHGVEIMKFHLEQSVGRLIRTERDWGTVTLLDNRVLTSGRKWGCDACFPVPMEKWYRDLPSGDEWVDMCYDLEEMFRNIIDSKDLETGTGTKGTCPAVNVPGISGLLAPDRDSPTEGFEDFCEDPEGVF